MPSGKLDKLPGWAKRKSTATTTTTATASFACSDDESRGRDRPAHDERRPPPSAEAAANRPCDRRATSLRYGPVHALDAAVLTRDPNARRPARRAAESSGFLCLSVRAPRCHQLRSHLATAWIPSVLKLACNVFFFLRP